MFGSRQNAPTPTDGAPRGNPGTGREDKKTLQERVEAWDVNENVLEDILNIIVAIITLCILSSWGLFTLTFDQHILSIIIIPLVVYLGLSNSGVKLRMRESLSMLIVADIACGAIIVMICLYLDSLFYNNDSDLCAMVVFAFIGIFGMLAFISRWKWFYYLSVPFVAIYMALFGSLYGLSSNQVTLVMFLTILIYAPCIYGHQFFFGFGRIMDKEGKIDRVTIEEQKKILAIQKVEKRAAKEERMMEEMEARIERKRAQSEFDRKRR